LRRDRDRGPDEIRADDHNLLANDVDGCDLYDRVGWGDAGGLKVDDPDAGKLV
jgi:hypothetical protein